MSTIAIVLITILIVVLLLILGVLTFLVYRLMKGQVHQEIKAAPEAQYHPSILERMKEMQKVSPKRADLFCPNHTEEPGEASCAICDRLFCKQCIKPFKTMHFCKEHLTLVMRHEWVEVLTIKTSSEDPEKGVHLYDEKKKIFEERSLPSYIETHYKIDVDDDHIETYLVLYTRPEDLDTFRSHFQV